MTSIKLIVRGATAQVEVSGPLTSGMVGIPVTIQYDSVWDGLTKNLVCRSGQWYGPVKGDVRTILNIGETATVAHEVMVADHNLYLGVEGYNADGTLVIPTIWAECGKIRPGANSNADLSADPNLPIWAQLQAQIEAMRGNGTNSDGGVDSGMSDTSENPVQNKVIKAYVDDKISGVSLAAMDYDQNVKAINHRGYNSVAPENTIPAYILSKQNGYNYAEADISFTSDGVAVLLHDSTIDRTSNGTGSISAMTYAEVLGYDFGSWKSAEYTGTKIPTFEEFIKLCKNIMLHPYIELKSNGSYTEAQIQGLVDIVKQHGMVGKVTWISFNAAFLGYVAACDETARLGFLPGSGVTEDAIARATALKTGKNEVFIDADNLYLTNDGIQLCIDAGLPLEIWTVNATGKITGMNPYVSGVTSDGLIAGKVLHENSMIYTPATVYTVTNNLSNVTSNNTQTAVVKNGSYSTKLTVDSGYALDAVTVTMDGTDITSTAYADGVVNIASVTGNVVITATAVAESGGGDSGEDPGEDPGGSGGDTTTGTLIHSWDFTQGLTDSVGNSDAVIVSGAAAQSADGLTIPDASSYVKLCDDIQSGDIVEVDVGECSADLGGVHGRFLMYPDSDSLYTNGTNIGTGFIYRNTGYWQQYANAKWSGETVESDANAFANKTIKLVAGDGVYLGSTKIAACALGGAPYTRLGIGSGATAFHNVTVLAVRIYRA